MNLALSETTKPGFVATRPECFLGLSLQDAELGVADLTITEERSNVVTFTSPFTSTGVQILMRKPERPYSPWATLLYPFSFGVWILIVVAFIVVGGLLYVIDRLSPYGWRNLPGISDKRHGKQSFNALNSYLFTISTFSWQGRPCFAIIYVYGKARFFSVTLQLFSYQSV